MINKYSNQFKEMYERMNSGESPLEVIDNYKHIFNDEGVHSNLGILSYFEDYMKKR